MVWMPPAPAVLVGQAMVALKVDWLLELARRLFPAWAALHLAWPGAFGSGTPVREQTS